jgi:hypothetical protein
MPALLWRAKPPKTADSPLNQNSGPLAGIMPKRVVSRKGFVRPSGIWMRARLSLPSIRGPRQRIALWRTASMLAAGQKTPVVAGCGPSPWTPETQIGPDSPGHASRTRARTGHKRLPKPWLSPRAPARIGRKGPPKPWCVPSRAGARAYWSENSRAAARLLAF